MRIRKEVYLILAVVIILSLLLFFRPKVTSDIAETNLKDVKFFYDSEGKEQSYIQFGDNSAKNLPNPIGMFVIVNGNIMEDSDIIAKDGNSMIPVEIFKDIVQAELTQSESNSSEFVLSTSDHKLTFRLEDLGSELDGKALFLPVAPVREQNKIYVPLKNFSESFGVSVNYTDGVNYTEKLYPVIPKFQQIFLSKYNSKLTPITPEEAIEVLKSELKKAYKVRFENSFKELDTIDGTATEEEKWRNIITNGLKISGENDRYYIVNLSNTFLIDKYTGKIYTFTEGKIYEWKEFDSTNKASLAI